MPPRIGPRKPVRVFLRLWREHYGLSQEQLGQRISPPVEKGVVSKWEKNGLAGALPLGVVAAFAEALGRETVDMYRLPPKGAERPSLDLLADNVDPATRDAVETMLRAAARKH